ncbi:MAG: gamma-glutamyl-phosphate reductase, partial [Xanthobacteraceae bacterium]
MSAKLEKLAANGDVAALMKDMGRRARSAARTLALAEPAKKTAALQAAAKAIRENSSAILQANAEDIAAAGDKLTPAFRDRLSLDAKRVAAMADGIDVVSALPDPVGTVMAAWERPNGLKIERVRTPLGVIAVIYESRPNV